MAREHAVGRTATISRERLAGLTHGETDAGRCRNVVTLTWRGGRGHSWLAFRGVTIMENGDCGEALRAATVGIVN